MLDSLTHVALADLLSKTVLRLMLSAFLGGVIGLERELKRRPAGLRTNMFICFGSAMFTILSGELAGGLGGDHTRIAAQIIPGIGFIGAGSILHSKGGVSGLTTAATIFVVASIGMACGGGLYLPAVFATILILLALQMLGWLERQLNLKPLAVEYSIVTEKDPDAILAELNSILDDCEMSMHGLRIHKLNGKQRVSFNVEGTRRGHSRLTDSFRQSQDVRDFTSSRGYEQE